MQRLEAIVYRCGDCGSNVWKLFIAHDSHGKARLVIMCANENCVAEKRKEFQVDNEEFVVWDEFDISNQGYDLSEEEIKQTEEIDKNNLN